MSIEVTLPAPRTHVIAPTAAAAPAHIWRRLPDAPVLGLIDNTKTRAGDLLNAIGRELKRRGVISSHFLYRKPDAAHSISEEVRADMLARSHVIISGVGD
ncbi:MAG: hypothetical protein FJY55_16375 [Betaproteobacteria bacterium]|nr:hypothetical protein [Betaproteobacteria bacterium]